MGVRGGTNITLSMKVMSPPGVAVEGLDTRCGLWRGLGLDTRRRCRQAWTQGVDLDSVWTQGEDLNFDSPWTQAWCQREPGREARCWHGWNANRKSKLTGGNLESFQFSSQAVSPSLSAISTTAGSQVGWFIMSLHGELRWDPVVFFFSLEKA